MLAGQETEIKKLSVDIAANKIGPITAQPTNYACAHDELERTEEEQIEGHKKCKRREVLQRKYSELQLQLLKGAYQILHNTNLT
jgi:hypothetical protein